jgi:hypothetical protein
MMTPLTSVASFEFFIADLCGECVKVLNERFVICDEGGIPHNDSLLENANILLESAKIRPLEEEVYKYDGVYVTHMVLYMGQRCLAAARTPAWARRGAEPRVPGRVGGGLR